MNDEALQRLRRVETRLTQLMTALGVPTSAQKPAFYPGPARFAGGRIILPSPHSSLKEIRDAIPAGHEGGPVDLYLGADRVGIFTKA